MNNPLLRRATAEFIGTYALVLAGCGAIMVNAQNGMLGHVGIALTFGLTILVMIAATGHISGAHFNPAVTVAFAIARHFPWREVALYLLAQFAAAILASVTLRLLIGDIAQMGMTFPTGDLTQALGIEVLATAMLMFVITAVATDTRAIGAPAAIAIGLTVMLNALWAGPLSGASMNPARSLGPALVAGVWNDQWLYLVAPVIGASLGALAYQLIREPSVANASVANAATHFEET